MAKIIVFTRYISYSFLICFFLSLKVEAIIESASSPHKTDGEEAATSNKGGSLEKKPEMSEIQQTISVEKEQMTEEKLPGSSNSAERVQISEKEKDDLKKIEPTNMNVIQPAVVPPGKEEIKEQLVESQIVEEKPTLTKEDETREDVVQKVESDDKAPEKVETVKEEKVNVEDVMDEKIEVKNDVNKSADEKILSEVQQVNKQAEGDLTGTTDSAVKGRSADGKSK